MVAAMVISLYNSNKARDLRGGKSINFTCFLGMSDFLFFIVMLCFQYQCHKNIISSCSSLQFVCPLANSMANLHENMKSVREAILNKVK